MFQRIQFFLLLVCVAQGSLLAEVRTWTDSTGKFKITAELVTVRDGKAYLEQEGGQVTPIAIEKLSIDDIRFIALMPVYRESVQPILKIAEANAKKTSSEAGTDARTQFAKIHVADESINGTVRSFKANLWGFKSVAFSPDGAFLACCGPNFVTVFDIDKANLLTSIENLQDSGSPTQIAFSPDGTKVLLGTDQGNILAWNFDRKGELTPLQKFSMHRGEVKSITISSDGERVFSMDADGGARYWKLKEGTQVFALESFKKYSGCTYISKKGGQGLATDGHTIALFDLTTSKQIGSMFASKSHVQCVAISKDGSRVGVGNGGDVEIWDVKSGRGLFALKNGSNVQWAADFSPKGTLLASSGNSRVTIWDMKTFQAVHAFSMADSGYVQEVAFSPDGIHVAAVGSPIGQVIEIFRLPTEMREIP